MLEINRELSGLDGATTDFVFPLSPLTACNLCLIKEQVGLSSLCLSNGSMSLDHLSSLMLQWKQKTRSS